jgi:PAS domain S-box-containing protein
MTAILPLLHFTVFLSAIGVSVFLLLKNPRALLNRLCFLLLITLSIWSLGYSGIHLSRTVESARFWVNISSLGWGPFLFCALCFYLTLIRPDWFLKNKLFLFPLGLIAAFFIYQQWLGHLVFDFIAKPWGWAGVWSTSIYARLFFVYVIFSALACLYLAFSILRKARTPRERRQAQLLSFTALVSVVLGSVTDIILPLLGLTVFPQIADVMVIIWEVGIVLSVTKYGLMSLTPVTAADGILNTMTDSLMLVDPDGIIIMANRATMELIVTPENEIQGTSLESHVVEKTTVKLLLQETSRYGKSIDHEINYITPGGRRIPVQVSASSVTGDLNTRLGFVVVARDITQRKKIARALQESEEKYHSLIENIKLGIFRTDPGTGRLLEFNNAMEEITGYSRAELLNLDVVNLYPSATDRNEFVRRLAVSPEKATLVSPLIRKDGSQIMISMVAKAIKDQNGKLLYVDGSIEDITERKLLEKQIVNLYEKEKQQREELQAEAKTRGIFIDILAHELRTPLTPMLASTDMLNDLMPDKGGVLKRLAVNISVSTHVLSRRLEELLDVARYSRGTFTLNKLPVDTGKYLNEVTARFKPSIDQFGQTLILEIAADLPFIEIDPSRLEQVIINLLSNASKFSPPNGRITLKARVLDTELRVEVMDEGIGITPEESRRIFQPYHRVEQDRMKFPGLGLGLTVSKQIVEAHGGKIWVDTTLARGSLFGFTIPLNHQSG